VERYGASLGLRGDAARGRALYQKSCLHCHQAGAEGHEAGPPLASFRSRTPEQLLVDLIDPNREVKPEYVNYRVLTRDGRLLDGLLAGQDSESVILKRGFGETDTVPRREIEKFESSGLSLMPEGLEQGIDLQQMADLLAFIRGYN
jgi:putative heme-binding domain-containing protein